MPDTGQAPLGAKSTRSRSGCWTCRKRHQKCDETKPGCINCQLRGVECGGYGFRLTDFTACSGQKGRLQMVSKPTRTTPDMCHTANPNRTKQSQARKRSGPSHARKRAVPRLSSTHNEIKANADQLPVSSVNMASMSADDSGQLTNDPMSSMNTSAIGQAEHDWSNLEFSRPSSACRDLQASDEERYNQVDPWSYASIESCHNGIFRQHDTSSDLAPWSRTEISPVSAVTHQGTAQHASTLLYDEQLSCFTSEIAEDIPPHIEQNDQSNFSSEDADDSNIITTTRETFHPHKSLTAFELHLLNHFLTDLAPRFLPAVGSDRNPYGVVYANLAKESLPLRNVILFASALHLTKLGQLPNEVIKTHRVAMRDSFRDALQAPEEMWALGMTVLLSIVLDVISTGMDSWASKLIGCRRLLELGFRRTIGRVSAEMNCVRVQYNWMSAMGRALLLGMQASHTIAELAPIDRAADDEDDDAADLAIQQHHWWANMPDFSMHLLLREATDLAIEVESIKTHPNSYNELLRVMPRVAELVQNVINWKPGEASVTPEYVADEVHFNNIWRQGMLCFVYHQIYSLPQSDPRIQGCVHASLTSFRQLSWLQACLWPAFMIAVHARTEEARSCYETRLRRMHTMLNFTAPLSIVLVLKNIWETLDNDDTGAKRWQDVVMGLGLELNILL